MITLHHLKFEMTKILKIMLLKEKILHNKFDKKIFLLYNYANKLIKSLSKGA